MDLKRITQKIYGISLPITNGAGENNIDAIKLVQVETLQSNKVKMEVLNLIMDIQDYDYLFISLEIKTIKNIRYDVITIEVKCRHTSKTHIQDIWFDVSNCTDDHQYLGSDSDDT